MSLLKYIVAYLLIAIIFGINYEAKTYLRDQNINNGKCIENSEVVDSIHLVRSLTKIVGNSYPIKFAPGNCHSLQYKGKIVELCTPLVFLIGMAKSGSSALYNYLVEDSRFISIKSKEIWHSHVPFADHLQVQLNLKDKRRRLLNYLSYFMLNGDVICNSENNVHCEIKYSLPKIRHEYLLKTNKLIQELYFNNSQIIPSELVQKLYLLNQSIQTIPYSKCVSSIIPVTNGENNALDPASVMEVGIQKLLYTIDATPEYHIYADIPEGIHKLFPNTKIILVVRDVFIRMISSYQYLTPNINNSMYDFHSFAHILHEDYDSYQQCIQHHKYTKDVLLKWIRTLDLDHWNYHLNKRSKVVPRPVLKKGTLMNYVQIYKSIMKLGLEPCDFRPFIYPQHNVFARVNVVSHMKWWSVYHNTSNILIINHEKLSQYPKQTMQRVLEFIGIKGEPNIPPYIYDLHFNGPNYLIKFKNYTSIRRKSSTDSSNSSPMYNLDNNQWVYKVEKDNEYLNMKWNVSI